VDHKLQAVVRLDVTSTGAVIEITGCLTDGGAGSLGALIRRTEALSSLPLDHAGGVATAGMTHTAA
jgi:hypothetical protein